MSSKYKVRENDSLYFLTITVIDWVDLFTRSRYSNIICESLNYCSKNKGLVVHAYVIMSNHIHLVVQARCQNLEEIIRDFKKHTSKQLIKSIIEHPESRREWLLKKFEFAAKRIKRVSKYKIWKDGFHPKELSTNELINRAINYVHENPVRAEIVFESMHYKYSSAVNYSGGNGEVYVEIIDLHWEFIN